MSVWAAYSTGALVPPGTPDVRIRYQRGRAYGTESWRVLADGEEVYATVEGYRAAHRWAQNTYRLTSTPMTAVYAEYEAAREEEYPDLTLAAAESGVNPYRKESVQ